MPIFSVNTDKAERFFDKFDLTSIETLDDAYESAYEREYSEVNTVFNAILSEFITSDSRTKFVLELIDKHVSRLEDFSNSIHDRKIYWQGIS